MVDIDVVPGTFVKAVGERLLRVVTDELLKSTRVELHGRISAELSPLRIAGRCADSAAANRYDE